MHVMPGEEFVSKFDKPRELYFVLHGTVHVIDDDNRVKRAIRSDVPDMAPICGEVRRSWRSKVRRAYWSAEGTNAPR